ncbi:MAG: hypothetical protein OXE53_19075 [Deltaproteobacteria bacterium]|nr:hypothetical protein [Deltaproteobacteria bacterium]
MSGQIVFTAEQYNDLGAHLREQGITAAQAVGMAAMALKIHYGQDYAVRMLRYLADTWNGATRIITCRRPTTWTT